jgi:hypothetical protein
LVSNSNTTNGIFNGIAFATTNYNFPNGTPGANILFERTNSNIVGKLHFSTKNSGAINDPCLIRMTIAENGNVGIGTTSPTSLLDVRGNISTTGTLDVSGRTKSSYLQLGSSTDTSRWISALNSSITNNSTTYGVCFGKAASSMNQCELGYGHISDGNTSNYMSFGLFGIHAMTLTGQGRLGIGTTTPTAQLQTTSNAIINNAGIGVVGSYGTTWAGFAHSNRMSDGNYAVLQQNNGQTMINASTGQTIELRINNASTAFIESERIGIPGSKTLEFGTDQPKQPDDGKIRFRGWSTFLDIVGTRPAGETGARCVKVYDILQVNSTNYSSDSNLKTKIQPLGRMLDKLENWEGKTFEWKKDETGKKYI